MPIPVIAITNVSTCLTDAQVEAVLPALQKQVSDDFKAYWEQDCTRSFLSKDQPLTGGWWQIVITDNPDQAGALGYREMTSQGTPLGKVFAKLDLQSGSSWTVTLSHELLEMLADPWINWCAMGRDSKIYALEVCDAVEADMNSDTRSMACRFRISSRPRGTNPRAPTGWISRSMYRKNWNSHAEAIFRFSIPPAAGRRSTPGATAVRGWWPGAAASGES
jgi:hypothetical protein